MRIWTVLTLLLSLAASAADAEIFQDTVHRTIPASSTGRLSLDAEFGDVQLTSTGGNQIVIDVARRVDTRDRAEAEEIFRDFDIATETNDQEIVVHGTFKNGWERGRWGNYCHNGMCLSYGKKLKGHQYRVQIPRSFNVKISTWCGDISVGDLQGEVEAFTSGGDIQIGKVGKSIRVETSGGDIVVGEVTADVNASTAGGDIEIRYARNISAETAGGDIQIASAKGNVKAETAGGDVEVHLLEQPSADCELETSGGDILVYLTPTAKMNVDAQTSIGEVSVDDFTISDAIRKEDEVRGKLNGGGPDLILRTSAGDIDIVALRR